MVLILLLGAAVPGVPVRAGEEAGSIESLERLLDRYPESEMRAPVLLMLGNLHMEREKERYLEKVEQYEDAGESASSEMPRLDYREAIRFFEKAAAFGPSFPGRFEALHGLGVCHEETGGTDKAVFYLTAAAEAVEDGPSRAAVLLRVGDLHFAAERWPAALGAYRAARAGGADRETQKLDYRVGWCHLKEGNFDKAGERFQEAADRAWASAGGGEESLGEILRSLGLVEAESGGAEPEVYAARFEADGYRRAALVEYGRVLLETDRPGPAAEAFRLALALDRSGPDGPEVHENLIEALTGAERKEEAGREMEELVRLYGPGGDWVEAHRSGEAAGAEHQERLLRAAWNGALLRYRSGGEEDLRVAVLLFERYVGDLGAREKVSQARLYAAEAWLHLGEMDQSLALREEITPSDLSEEDRRYALHGAVLSLKDVAGREKDLARAALRYDDSFSGTEESEKALLLAAERLEEAGMTAGAIGLCGRVAERTNSPFRGEAAIRAARLSSATGDRSGAERWFLLAAEGAADEEERKERIEGAAASAFLVASELEKKERFAAAAARFDRVFREYGGSETGRNALLREIVCLARCDVGLAVHDDGPGILSLADSAAVLFAGREGGREALRSAAAAASREDRDALAAELMVRSHAILHDPSDLLDAGVAWERADRESDAVACYERATASEYEDSLRAEAFYRLGSLCERRGEYAAAAAAFDGAAVGDRRMLEIRVRSGLAWLEAGDPAKGEDRLKKAITRFDQVASPDEEEELLDARASLGLVRSGGGEWERVVVAWRTGGTAAGEKASSLLGDRLALCRRVIEYRFEDITEEAALLAARTLDRFGRTAFLREWEAGRTPEAAVVDPSFREASDLYLASGERGGEIALYENLADSLIVLCMRRINETPAPPESWESFDPASAALASWLDAVRRTEEGWRITFDLLERERSSEEARKRTGEKRTTLALAAGQVLEESAERIRRSPAPPGLEGEDLVLYRSLLDERARQFDALAEEWYLDLPGASPAVAGPRISRGSPDKNRTGGTAQ